MKANTKATLCTIAVAILFLGSWGSIPFAESEWMVIFLFLLPFLVCVTAIVIFWIWEVFMDLFEEPGDVEKPRPFD